MNTADRIHWSDNDHCFGPFLYAPDKYHNFAIVLGSGDEEEHPGCRLRMSAFGHTVIVALPAIIKPWKRRVIAHGWDEATVARMGCGWYFDYHEREYGFSYSNDMTGMGGGFLQVFYGYEINGENTSQRWSCCTPWNNWTHVRHSFYDLDGEHYWDEPQRNYSFTTKEGNDEFAKEKAIEDACPTLTFRFSDFDGEEIDCKTRIEEREWQKGTGWFRWLRHFCKPIIHRSLDLEFSKETGRRKGSWKGGTTGHAIEMLPGELHASAFLRYCEGEDSRNGKRDMKLIAEV